MLSELLSWRFFPCPPSVVVRVREYGQGSGSFFHGRNTGVAEGGHCQGHWCWRGEVPFPASGATAPRAFAVIVEPAGSVRRVFSSRPPGAAHLGWACLVASGGFTRSFRLGAWDFRRLALFVEVHWCAVAGTLLGRAGFGARSVLGKSKELPYAGQIVLAWVQVRAVVVAAVSREKRLTRFPGLQFPRETPSGPGFPVCSSLGESV